MNDVTDLFFSLTSKFASEVEIGSGDQKIYPKDEQLFKVLPWLKSFKEVLLGINKELNICKSTLTSVSRSYSMITRKETLLLSLDERDEIKSNILTILNRVELQSSVAISLWAENFDIEYSQFLDEFEDEINWDSFFHRGDHGNEIWLFIQRIDMRLWLFASALQTLLIKHRSVSSFFVIADSLRVARENEINAPRLFFEALRRDSKPILSPTLPSVPKPNSKIKNHFINEHEEITFLPSSLPATTLAFERPIDVQQEELFEIQRTQKQLEAIAALQTMLSEHLEIQSISVDTIFDEAHLSLGHVGRGLDCLQKASSNPEGPFKIGAIFLICLSTVLILFDIIN